MKKSSLLFFALCSLFQMHVVAQNFGVEKKYPHIVIKSIINYTPYNLVVADKDNVWYFVLESGYAMNTSAMIQAMNVQGDNTNDSPQKLIELIQFIAVEKSKTNELISNTLVSFAVELIDFQAIQHEDVDAATEYEGLLIGLVITNVNNEQCCVVKPINDDGSGIVEINVGLYIEKAADILEKFKFVGNFEVLNQ